MERNELNWAVLGCGVIANEMATILLKNTKGQMATVALSMHSKQPKIHRMLYTMNCRIWKRL